MEERIQKILAAYGIASRRAAEQMMRDGRVRVNGNTARPGDSADVREDVIEVDGKPLRHRPQKRYLMLNKPRGFVTTMQDEQGRRTAFELVQDCGERVYPVGRLDLNSEGLLLFTNDGAFANHLMHPSHEVEKVYLAWIVRFSPQKLEQLQRLRNLDGEAISPPQVRIVRASEDQAQLEIVIHEGKNRQIRRMCEQTGMHVTRLRRIREGTVTLGDLKTGAWRDLTAEEIDALMK